MPDAPQGINVSPLLPAGKSAMKVVVVIVVSVVTVDVVVVVEVSVVVVSMVAVVVVEVEVVDMVVVVVVDVVVRMSISTCAFNRAICGKIYKKEEMSLLK